MLSEIFTENGGEFLLILTLITRSFCLLKCSDLTNEGLRNISCNRRHVSDNTLRELRAGLA